MYLALFRKAETRESCICIFIGASGHYSDKILSLFSRYMIGRNVNQCFSVSSQGSKRGGLDALPKASLAKYVL